MDGRSFFPSPDELIIRVSDTLLPTTWSNWGVLLGFGVALAGIVVFWLSSHTGRSAKSIFVGAGIIGLLAFCVWGGLSTFLYLDASRRNGAVGATTLLWLLSTGVLYGALMALTAFSVLVLSALVYEYTFGASDVWSSLIPHRRKAVESPRKEVSDEEEVCREDKISQARLEGSTEMMRRVVVQLFEMLCIDNAQDAVFAYIDTCRSPRKSDDLVSLLDEVLPDLLQIHRELEGQLPSKLNTERLRVMVEHMGSIALKYHPIPECRNMIINMFADQLARFAFHEDTKRLYEAHRSRIESHLNSDEFKRMIRPLGFGDSGNEFNRRHVQTRKYIESLLACDPPDPPPESLLGQMRKFARELLEECDVQNRRHPNHETQHRHNAKICLEQLEERIAKAKREKNDLPNDPEVERVLSELTRRRDAG